MGPLYPNSGPVACKSRAGTPGDDIDDVVDDDIVAMATLLFGRLKCARLPKLAGLAQPWEWRQRDGGLCAFGASPPYALRPLLRMRAKGGGTKSP